MNIQVAQRIRELMKENGLTQVALAEKIGLRQNTISAWLLGKKEPSIRSLWLLADYFNTDIDYIVGRKDYWAGGVSARGREKRPHGRSARSF